LATEKDKRALIRVDRGQADEIDSYCKITGVTRANAIRQAIAHWLMDEKPQRLAAFTGKRKPKGE
jgi:hypothetical protein